MNARAEPEAFADDLQAEERAKDTSLGSLKLKWMDQIETDLGLSDVAVRVGSAIRRHINKQTRRAWPRMETIANGLGRNERTVRDAVHALVRRQHLAVCKRGSGNLNQYELVVNDLTVEARNIAEAAATAVSRKPKKVKELAARIDEAMSPFDRFIAAFPAQDRQYPPALAARRYEEWLAAGVTAATLLAGAEAYRELCDARGHTGTLKVEPPARWLKMRGWLELPPGTGPGQ